MSDELREELITKHTCELVEETGSPIKALSIAKNVYISLMLTMVVTGLRDNFTAAEAITTLCDAIKEEALSGYEAYRLDELKGRINDDE